MKRNIYLVSYIPFISILMFSMALSLFGFEVLKLEFERMGLYQGFHEYISEANLNIVLFTSILVFVLMFLSLLKLLAETILKLSLLFFTKDREGDFLIHSQMGSLFYLGGGLLAILLSKSWIYILVVLVLSTIGFFVYTFYKLGKKVTLLGVVGVIFFQATVWGTIGISLFLVIIKTFNFALNQFLKIM